MTTTVIQASTITRTNAEWLPRLVPGILRIHRTALISVAIIYLTFTVIALTVVHQVGHPRAVIAADQAFNGTLYSISTYAYYLPFLVAVFIGAPLFARSLETGTFRFAWTQSVGRRRLVATTLVAFILELAVLSFILGSVLSRLWFDLSPQFPGLWNNHVFFTGPWMLAFSSVIGLLAGALLGVVLRRMLTALAATTAAIISTYLWAIMFPIFQETLLWFAKRMPANYPDVPLVNGNYLAHYSFAYVNTFLTDRSGRVMSMDKFNSQIYPKLPQAQKLALSQNAVPEFHRLGLTEWQGALFHQQFHGFLMAWMGFGTVTILALVVAIFVALGGNDWLLPRRRRK